MKRFVHCHDDEPGERYVYVRLPPWPQAEWFVKPFQFLFILLLNSAGRVFCDEWFSDRLKWARFQLDTMQTNAYV